MRVLHHKWSMLYDYQQKGRATMDSWKDAIKNICTVGDIENLLYTLENTGEAEEWPTNSNIHFFREGIEPMWEDEKNVNGGKWVVEIDKRMQDYEKINDLWKKTIAFCVSEQADEEIICGCVFSPRKYVDRIALWTNSKGSEAEKVGHLWKKFVEFENIIGFKVHENALKGHRDRTMDLFKA